MNLLALFCISAPAVLTKNLATRHKGTKLHQVGERNMLALCAPSCPRGDSVACYVSFPHDNILRKLASGKRSYIGRSPSSPKTFGTSRRVLGSKIQEAVL